MTDDRKLADKVAIVTGGGRGIGEAVCEALAREGAEVVVAARSEPEIDRVAARLVSDGSSAVAQRLDVTEPASVAAMVEATLARFGRIDILVNNAGIYRPAKFLDYTFDDWKRVVDVNLHGTFLCTRAVLPAMLRQRYGKIVNVASTAGKWGSLFQSAYNASKHGVMGLTRSLALEVAAQGITVNAVCPGYVETPLLDQGIEEWSAILGVAREGVVEFMKGRIPQGRFLRPEEVAAAVVYLSAPESDGVTGIGITLAGGMLLI
jgi:3-hydroxybutyrate dehydrogenase